MMASGKSGKVGDGICDIYLNNEECCFDGGDCSTCATCPLNSKVNDGFCDEDLLTEGWFKIWKQLSYHINISKLFSQSIVDHRLD